MSNTPLVPNQPVGPSLNVVKYYCGLFFFLGFYDLYDFILMFLFLKGILIC